MSAAVPAKRLRILVHSHDHAHHHALTTEVLDRARHAHLAGATVFQSIEGTDATRRHLFGEDVALVILIVDTPEAIAAFVGEIADLTGDATVIVDDVNAFRA